MPLKIISGGQTGADQGGLFGARDAGYSTGGYAPNEFLTEDGRKPSLLREFGLSDSGLDYKGRTVLNVKNSDLTIWFGKSDSAGAIATTRAAKTCNKPIIDATNFTALEIARLISQYSVVNVAGNRESLSPGIFNKVRDTMRESLEILKTLNNDLKLRDDR